MKMSTIKNRVVNVQAGLKSLIVLAVIVSVLVLYFAVPTVQTAVNTNVIPTLANIRVGLTDASLSIVKFIMPTYAAWWRLALICLALGVFPIGYIIFRVFLSGRSWASKSLLKETGLNPTTPASTVQHTTPAPPPKPIEKEAP